ncbi:MAG: hypothetical protein F6K47_33405 [Symploca sp. SIO2E6]|nr:hypothetical protein [Symploca sp. SIO2E6]
MDSEDLEDLTQRLQERIGYYEDFKVERELDLNPPDGAASPIGRLIPGLLKVLILASKPYVEQPIEIVVPVIEC